MVIVDIIGIGQGVYDKLRHRVANVNIVGLNVGELASNDDRYPRLRDELWCLTRELFEQRAISIPDDPDLLAELTNLKAAPNDDGRMKVEGKRELKARGVSSPNKADCVMMLAYFSAAHRRKMTGPRRNRRSAVADSWRTI